MPGTARLSGIARALERVPLGWRLGALLAVPLAVLIVFAAITVENRRAEASRLGAFSDRMESIERSDLAIRALQVERDLSVRRLTVDLSPDAIAELDEHIAAQRTIVDERIAIAGIDTTIGNRSVGRLEPRPGAGPGGRPPPPDGSRPPPPDGSRPPAPDGPAGPERQPPPEGSIPGPVEDLDALRALVDLGEPQYLRTFEAYSTLIDNGLTLILESARNGDGRNVSSDVLAYENLLSGRERLAQLRTLGALWITGQEPNEVLWTLARRALEAEDLYLSEARRLGGSEFGEAIGAVVGIPGDPANLNRFRGQLLNSVGDATIPIDGWLTTTAARLQSLDDTSTSFLMRLAAAAESQAGAARTELTVIAVVTLLLLSTIAAAAWLVIRSISAPLHRLAAGAREAAEGRAAELDVYESNDAIGEIGAAVGELSRYLTEVADAADAIASGDLERAIEPRSPDDRLGVALDSMTRQLGYMVSESRLQSQELAATVDVLETREAVLREAAEHDPLTGLTSRSHLEHVLNVTIESAAERGERAALIFVDLDGFKKVNDSLGHSAGDELLRSVGQRLQGAVRADDTVARLRGDEFVAVIRQNPTEDQVRMAAHRMLQAIEETHHIAGTELRVAASIGTSMFPRDGESSEELLQAADRAMYRSKREGRTRAAKDEGSTRAA